MLTFTKKKIFWGGGGRIVILGKLILIKKVLHCKEVPDRQGQELWWDGQSMLL